MNKFTGAQKSAVKLLTFFYVFIALLCVLYNEVETVNFTYYGDEFIPTSEMTYEIVPHENTTSIFANTNDEEGALVLDHMTFEPNTYEFDFQYATESDGAEFSIVSLNTLNTNNTSTVVFFEQAIDKNETFIKGTFTMNSYADDVSVRITVPKNSDFAVGRITVTPSTFVTYDSYVFLLLTTIIYAFGLYFVFSKNSFAKPAFLLGQEVSGKRMFFALAFIMGALSLFIIYPMLKVQLTGGYDIYFHLNRIEGIKSALLSGQFPVRIHPDHLNGHGYPNGIFYPELFLYFPAVLRILGMSVKNSYITFVFFINILTSLIAYISFAKLFKSRYAGIMCCLLFTLSPYRFATLYDKSALGEFIAMAFLPLVFYGFYSVVFGNKNDWPYLVLGASGLLQSHILTTLIIAVLCLGVCIVCVKKLFNSQKRFVLLALSAIVTVLVNLWFLGPFLQMSFQLNVDVFERAPPLSPARITAVNELFSINFLQVFRDMQTGASHSGISVSFLVLSLAFMVYVFLVYKNKKGEQTDKLIKLGLYSFVLSFIAIVATTIFFPWNVVQMIPVVNAVVGSLQFPSRLFIISSLFLSVLAGVTMLVYTKPNFTRPAFVVCVALTLVLSTWVYLDNVAYYSPSGELGSHRKIDLKADTTLCIGMGEYISKSSDIKDILSKGSHVILLHRDIIIENTVRSGSNMEFDYRITNYVEGTEYAVKAPFTYYPQYNINVNGVDYDATIVPDNYVKATLVGENGRVKISYKQPLTFMLSFAVSVVSTLGFVAYFVLKKRRLR